MKKLKTVPTGKSPAGRSEGRRKKVAKGRGVYFLGNDTVFDLALAFLNSFREFNPTIPLCLVPFNSDCNRLRQLQAPYDFTIYDDSKVLARCDAVSAQLFGKVHGECRKMVFWEGPYREFAYFDIDSIVLSDVNFIFDFLSSFSFIVSQANIKENFRYVWRESIAGVGSLSQSQLLFSGSAGFLASRHGYLSVATAIKKLPQMLALREHMAVEYPDQALLNFLFVTSGKSYIGLNRIAALCPGVDIPVEKWAGSKTKVTLSNWQRIRPKPLYVHWAGLWQQGEHEKNSLWKYFRQLRNSLKKFPIKPNEKLPVNQNSE